MKKLDTFPISVVKEIATKYNKSFHSKLFTLFASSESEIHALVQELPVQYDYCFCFLRDDEGQWFVDEQGLLRIKEWILQGAQQGTDQVMKIYQAWEKNWDRYLERSRELLTTDLTDLTNEDLYKQFEEFFKLYVKAGSVAYMTDSFMSTGGEDWLEELLREELSRLGIKESVAAKVRMLTSPLHLSFTLEEEQTLLKVAVAINEKYQDKWPTLSVLAKEYPELRSLLEEHEQRYFWIKNNYYNVEYQGVKEIYSRAKRAVEEAKQAGDSVDTLYQQKDQELKDFRTEREKLLDSLELSQFHRNVLEIAILFSKWKDTRKSGVYIGMHHFDCFLEEISGRTGMSKRDLNFLVLAELRDVFLGGKDMSEKIKARKDKVFFAVTTKGYFIAEGQAADKYFKYFMTGQPTEVSELKGVAASPGQARGQVRVIRKTNDMKEFQEGEILVTNQTTPDFVPIMRKAAAIVTEQGGITSHAAVVSRELKKPCVIGTKIATQAFKNGDRVEVDAEKGTVKKI